MRLSSRTALVMAFAVTVLLAAQAAEARQAPVLAAPSVAGSTVTFDWSATAGATGYRLDYGVAPGAYLGNLPVGAVTTFTLPGAPNGVFFLRVVALTPGGDVPSNEVRLQLPSPPAMPTALNVARNGLGIVVSWQPGAGGGTPTSYTLLANAPGFGAVALPVTTTLFAAGPVPVGAYTFQVQANNAAGSSAPTAVVNMTMPSGGACDPPPPPVISQSVFGGFVNLTWTPVGGASAYVLTGYQNGNLVGSVSLSGSTTRFSINLPESAWRIDVAAVFACGAQGTPASANIVIDQSTLKMQPRTPDPAPGQVLPTPSYFQSVVVDIANRFAGDLRNSCRDTGGNNRWLFRLVSELRSRDKRWGLNWKRANVGDMSQDIVTYNYSSDPDEGTFNTRVYDVISGHCGNNPTWNTTEVTVIGSRGSIWTIQPYIAAGNIP